MRARQRRNSVDVVCYAVLTAVVVAGPLALLTLWASTWARVFISGAGLTSALQRAVFGEDDWEQMPFLIGMAALGGAALAVPAAALWLFLADRVRRPWAAHLAAGVFSAAGASLLGFLDGPWAAATAVAAGVVAVVAAPRLGFSADESAMPVGP